MKKRHLRKSIEIALIIVTTILFMFLGMINDMSIEFIPFYLLGIIVIGFNTYILKKYGKGIIYE